MDARERRKVPAFTRILALMCVRQSRLETLHEGLSPITHTGDYSDVVVVDACQRRSKISPPGRSKTSPLNVMRYAVLGGCPGSP